MYPTDKMFDAEIENYTWSHGEEFKNKYRETLNACIEQRYRRRRFQVNWAVFNDTPVSTVVCVKPRDKIIKVGINSDEHYQLKKYPDTEYIINQIVPVSKLVVAGFHLWDCVDKVAEAAHKKGLQILVDEDLTEMLPGIITTFLKGFKIKKYPDFNPAWFMPGYMADSFYEARKGKPWMRQRI